MDFGRHSTASPDPGWREEGIAMEPLTREDSGPSLGAHSIWVSGQMVPARIEGSGATRSLETDARKEHQGG